MQEQAAMAKSAAHSQLDGKPSGGVAAPAAAAPDAAAAAAPAAEAPAGV